MKLRVSFIILACLLPIVFAACDNDKIGPGETGSLTIEFDNCAGEEDLELNKAYMNDSGETFEVTKLNYYISNIKLHSGGKEFVVPQDSSYFLIMEDNAASQFVTINNIPAGNYDAITFTIGVDSLRSTMDISRRPGVLDPAQGHDGMYWTWNSGYIFFKMEGTSPSAPAGQDHKFYYHIGGFGGYEAPTLNNIRETTVSMGTANVNRSGAAAVRLRVDVLEFFRGPTSFRIADYPAVMFSEFSKNVSENYVNMFKYDNVDN